MSARTVFYRGGPVFDGTRLLPDAVVRVEAGRIADIGTRVEGKGEVVDLDGGIFAPGYVDLQVNGGGGVMFNADPSLDTLDRMAAAHRRLGACTILPTLITATPEVTRAAIAAVRAAVAAGVPGIAGLHLEGPHLSIARKGAHDASLIRPMEEADLAMLAEAAEALPALMVTLAPENATPAQVRALVQAGAVVSLGHSDADYETCFAYAEAGASCATHLFNAMSQLGSRAPGLVGAALASGRMSAGLIADGIHVHPAAMRTAWMAKQGPGRIFLVSDAMAPAGTDATEFDLDGRRITRRDGRLTLADGTLAGADLDLTAALRVLTAGAGVPLEAALAAATSVPADLMGLAGAGRLQPGSAGPFLRIAPDLSGVDLLA